MFEKVSELIEIPPTPLQRGAKFLKVPLEKGDLEGSAGVRSHTKKFSNTLLDVETGIPTHGMSLQGFFLGTTVRNGKFYRDCLWSGQTRLEVILRPR